MDRERADDMRRRLELCRLSVLAELQWQRRSLDSVRQMAAAIRTSPSDDLTAIHLTIIDRLAEALASNRQIETLLGDADRSLRELQVLLAAAAD